MSEFAEEYSKLTPAQKQLYIVGYCMAWWLMNTRVYMGVGYLK